MGFEPPLVAILFDLDETLCRTSGYFFREIFWLAVRSLREGPGQPFRILRILQTFRRVREYLRGSPQVPDLHHEQFALTANRLSLPVDQVSRVVRPLLYDRTFPGLGAWCEAGLELTLTTLRRAGLKLGVLSDYPVKAKLEGMGLAGFEWDILLSSEDVDAMKPQPALFTQALARLSVEAGRVLYVGDRPDTDVAGARAVGMRACLVRRFGRRAPGADLVVDRLSELVGAVP